MENMAENPEVSWRSQSFRQNVISKIEEAIRQSGNPTTKSVPEMETHVFQKAKTREEYLGFVARLIIHVREMKIPEKPMPQQKIRQRHSSKDTLSDRIAEDPSILQLEKTDKADELHTSIKKRFSPSKEFSLASSSEEKFKPKGYLKNEGIQKVVTPSQELDNILESPVYVSSPNVAYKYTEKMPSKSNTSVFEEESFISQPIPCGQPTSHTQSSTKSLPNRPEAQSPIECQDADSTINENLVKSTNTPLDVNPEKCSNPVEINDSVPVKDTARGKRKRKSKGDKASKKVRKAKSLVCIQYTDKQIQNMIEIIKNFQFEKKK